VIRHSLGSLNVGGDSPPPTSGFVAACPRLTELTVICPHPSIAEEMETGYLLDPVGSVRSATSELVNACKTLPDFDTLWIVHGCRTDRDGEDFHVKDLRREYMEHVDGAKDVAISLLKEPETGYREGEGRRKVTLRVIQLVAGHSQRFYAEFVKVEEYEV
jgi:hypothetical protein